jgi:Secretion system C-terminal sorting domain
MKLLVFLSFLFFFLGNSLDSSAQSCSEDSLIIFSVNPTVTDSNIPLDFGKHYTFYNPDCNPQGTLLLHLVGTGGNPSSSQIYPTIAANNGFHVLSLKYNNDTSVQLACNNSPDVDCHYKLRKEIIEGIDYSPIYVVDSVNSIYHRLIKLLQYMDTNNPSQNWNQFYTVDSVHWNSVILSGHSQGGGHAPVIAISKPVKRVLMFAAPNDYSASFTQYAPWTNMAHVTPDSAYFSFNNLYDGVGDYDWQYQEAVNLGESTFGDSTLVDGNSCTYNNSHNLYTIIDSNFLANHGMVISDQHINFDGQGDPVFKSVWLYMLGIPCTKLKINANDWFDFEIFPNPSSKLITIKTVDAPSGFEVEVLNAFGQTVISKSSGSDKMNIDISELPAGLYFLKIRNQIKRFIKA